MATGRIKFFKKGLEQILGTVGTAEALEQVADEIIMRAEAKGGFGYHTVTKPVKMFKLMRLRTTIRTEGKSAANESEKKALISSLH